jgi:hypothetical protein
MSLMQPTNTDPSTYSDAAMKKYLTSSLEAIDVDTAGASGLLLLAKLQGYCTATSRKFQTRFDKRANEILVNSYKYEVPMSSMDLEFKAKFEASKANKLDWFNQLSPEAQARSLEYDAVWNETRKREYDESNSRSLKTLQKESATADWFNVHCSKIDAKIDEITAKIPGYCTDIVVPPPAKKPKPSIKAVQIILARAFRESDGSEPIEFLSKLNSQLKDSDIEEAKLAKTITARATKLADRAVTEDEREYNNGVRKLDLDAHDKDHAEKRLLAWFQQHSVAIKAKIASVTADGVVN